MSSHDPDPPSRPEGAPPLVGRPRWVTVLIVTGLAIAILVVVIMLILGGEHGPGRHVALAW